MVRLSGGPTAPIITLSQSSGPLPSTSHAQQEHDWAGIVSSIQRGDESGTEELFRVFSRGVRFFLARPLGAQDCEDRMHDVLITVVEAIRNNRIREPERVMGFVRTIARRRVMQSEVLQL